MFGGFYQPTYLAEMRRGLVRALRETGGYEEEAAIIEAKRSAMTLGLLYLLRSRESGRFPFPRGSFWSSPFRCWRSKQVCKYPSRRRWSI